VLTESSFLQKGKIIAKLIGKYASTSVLATSVDFTTFHFALTNGDITAVQSTIIGRLAGALVAFSLHRAWVFKNLTTTEYSEKNSYKKILFLKYMLGIVLGLGLNVAGVWFLNDILEIDAWSSRIIAAVAVWSFVFFYNQRVVFKEKIIADQDFAEVEEGEIIDNDADTEGVII
jgi:putative flippase GtrA